MVCSAAGCGLKSPDTAATTAATTAAAAATEAAKAEGTETEGAVSDASGDPQITLVYAEVNPLDTIVGQTDTAFKEKVEELSGGSIKVDLQASSVLGAEHPVANYKSNAFQEVAPNLILNGHQLGLIEIVITEDAWDKMTEAQQQCVVEAARYAADFNAELSEKAEAEVLEELKASGVNVVEVEDKTPWQESVKDVVASATKGNEELYQKILDLDK